MWPRGIGGCSDTRFLTYIPDTLRIFRAGWIIYSFYFWDHICILRRKKTPNRLCYAYRNEDRRSHIICRTVSLYLELDHEKVMHIACVRKKTIHIHLAFCSSCFIFLASKQYIEIVYASLIYKWYVRSTYIFDMIWYEMDI